MEVKEGIKPSSQSYQDRVLSLNYITTNNAFVKSGAHGEF